MRIDEAVRLTSSDHTASLNLVSNLRVFCNNNVCMYISLYFKL